jgi:hypothetical protein
VGSLHKASAVLLFSVVVVFVACDLAKDLTDSSSPPPPTTAHIDLVIAPSPVPVTVSCPAPTNPAFCLASLNPTVTVKETAGIGGRIDSIEVTLRNVTLSRDETKITLGSDWLARQAGTNRLEARAQLALQPVVSGYPIPASGPRPQLRIVLGIQFTDDKGNVLFQSVQADVTSS